MNEETKAVINVYDNELELVRGLSKVIVDLAYVCQQHHGKFVVALSGGSTPVPLYNMLATSEFSKLVDWKKCYFFLSDERCVPLDSDDSNFKMVHDHLFSKIPVPESNIFKLKDPDKDAEQAASLYEKEIRKYCEIEEELPQFDLILLGLGADGHTASLFPDTKALSETKKLCVANHVPKLNAQRITFTYPLINNARNVYFLVKGEAKQDIVKSVLVDRVENYPASHVGARPPSTKEEQEEKDCAQTCTVKLCESNSTEWYLDEDAAQKIFSQSNSVAQ